MPKLNQLILHLLSHLIPLLAAARRVVECIVLYPLGVPGPAGYSGQLCVLFLYFLGYDLFDMFWLEEGWISGLSVGHVCYVSKEGYNNLLT